METLRLIDNILTYSFIILSSSFCLLASVVLIYYVRRRYLLHFDIKSISQDELMLQSFQNHRKNLRIKALISNFIIIIVVVEIVYIFSNLFITIQGLFPFLEIFKPFLSYSLAISFQCHLPILCMFLKVLWLTYLNSPYKYTIIRWTWYIVIRGIVVSIGGYIEYSAFFPNNLYTPLCIIGLAMLSFALISDFIIYLVYARRLYIQLKSREKEARWFKDRAEYRTARSLRLHYKIATILVTIGIGGLISNSPEKFLHSLLLFSSIIPFDGFDGDYYLYVFDNIMMYYSFVCNLGFILYLSLYNLNYLYLVSMMVFNYCKQKRQQTNVNNKIKPIVKNYHDTLYYRRC